MNIQKTNKLSTISPLFKVKQTPLISIINKTNSAKIIFDSSSTQYLCETENLHSLTDAETIQMGVVCPCLPHICELIFLNTFFLKFDYKPKMYTSQKEEHVYNDFLEFCQIHKIEINFHVQFLSSVLENKTFLSDLENALIDENIVICFGENNLSTFQMMKHRQKLLHNESNKIFKILLWQTSPRPPEASLSQRTANGSLLPHAAREKTIRNESFRSSDALICFDKDSSNWAYLEGAKPQKIKRMNRSISIDVFSNDHRVSMNSNLRKLFNFKENDIIVLHLGPAEIESGCLDSLYAFKTLTNNLKKTSKNIKLLFISAGNAVFDLRKIVLDLGLDDKVFFLSSKNEKNKKHLSNQMIQILPLADFVIHGPLVPTNSSSHSYLDVTYEVLAAVSYGIPVCSNGTGWIGEWCRRFFPVFSSGNPFSLSRCLNEQIQNNEKSKSNSVNAKKAIVNEMNLNKSCEDFFYFIKTMTSKFVFSSEPTPEIDFNLIELKIQNHEYLESIDLIELGFAQKSLTEISKSKLYRYVADCFTKLGDLESGMQNYVRSIECDPCCSKPYIGLGSIALQQSNPHAAIPQFHKAIALSPQDDMAYLGLGLSYSEIGDKETAMDWCAVACEHNPINEVAIFQLTQLAYALNAYSKAIERLACYLNHKPENTNIRYSLAGLLYKNGDFKPALHHLNQILQSDPSNTQAHDLLSKLSKDNKLIEKKSKKSDPKRRLA